MAYAIATSNLTKSFGRNNVVQSLNLAVPYNGIYGFLGPNGAGKTTTIKMIMNILKPTSGAVTVMGKPSVELGPEQLAQIGYVSENQDMPDWMTVKYFLNYCRTMYPQWDQKFCQELLTQFDLPLHQRLRDLSRGMKMKAALISSLAYRPKLLILDEPFSGLDSLVREELISGFLEITRDQDWTILVSSHDLDEVERLADWIGIIDRAELKIQEETASLIQRFKRVEVALGSPSAATVKTPESWLRFQEDQMRVTFVESCYQPGETEKKVRELFPQESSIQVFPQTLKEIFVALARQYKISNL
ncbi:MAG: ABC transporter ATP-binding protein [Candidatus Omnitrophota bacterium]